MGELPTDLILHRGEPIVVARRYHDFSCGHRVVGHEGKCALLHGHNYRITFTVRARSGLDAVGRVLDFSEIKRICNWVESAWDHRFLAWEKDPLIQEVMGDADLLGRKTEETPTSEMLRKSIVWLPFNPTAENIALHLLQTIGPELFADTDCELIHVNVEETRKCRAEAYL